MNLWYSDACQRVYRPPFACFVSDEQLWSRFGHGQRTQFTQFYAHRHCASGHRRFWSLVIIYQEHQHKIEDRAQDTCVILDAAWISYFSKLVRVLTEDDTNVTPWPVRYLRIVSRGEKQ